MKNQTLRLAITGALIILAFIGFWNTLKLWTLTDDEKTRMEEVKPGSVNELERKSMRLGLDLQGGIHVVLRVMKEKIEPSARDDAVDRAIQVIRNRVDFTGVTEPIIQKQGDDKIIVDLPGYTDAERAEDIIGQTAQLEFKLLETFENGDLLLKRIDSLVAEVRAAEKEESGEAGEATEVVKDDSPKTGDMTPIDTGDSTETDVFADLLGDDSTEFFDEGLFDSETNPFTQYLEHWLRGSKSGAPWPAYYVLAKDRRTLEAMLNMPEVKRAIPLDVQFAWSTRSEIRNAQTVYGLYILKSKVQFLGKFLENIKLGRGQFQEPTVDFRLTGQGAAAFSRLAGPR